MAEKETHKDGLTHEWERLSVPQITVVYSTHKDIREYDTDVLVDLKPQGVVETCRTDEVPVKRPRQKTHSFVVAGAAEDITEDRA